MPFCPFRIFNIPFGTMILPPVTTSLLKPCPCAFVILSVRLEVTLFQSITVAEAVLLFEPLGFVGPGFEGFPGIEGLEGLPGSEGLEGLPGSEGLEGLPGSMDALKSMA
jgi:hypothetical protein